MRGVILCIFAGDKGQELVQWSQDAVKAGLGCSEFDQGALTPLSIRGVPVSCLWFTEGGLQVLDCMNAKGCIQSKQELSSSFGLNRSCLAR